MNTSIDIEKKYKPFVYILSAVIPAAVAVLFGVKIEGVDLSFLPAIYATLNGITALLLVFAVISIKNGKRDLHQKLMRYAIICSLLFLVMYVAYHMTSDSTVYGDLNKDGVRDAAEAALAGATAWIYFGLLISHITLSMIVIPFVMMTYLKGWSNKIEEHRKWAKFTFPIWLYVAVTGVAVYFMISPYY